MSHSTPPRSRSYAQGHRRGDRHFRQHRVDAQEHSRQQRQGRHVGPSTIPAWPDRDGRLLEPASRSQGDLPASVACRSISSATISTTTAPSCLSYGFEYVAMMETNNVSAYFKFDRHDTFEWYSGARRCPTSARNHFKGQRCRPGTISSSTRTMTSFGKSRRSIPYLTKVLRADAQHLLGLVRSGGISTAHCGSTDRLEKHDKNHQNFLVNPAPGTTAAGRAAPATNSAASTSAELLRQKYFREKVQPTRGSNWHLKGKGNSQAA